MTAGKGILVVRGVEYSPVYARELGGYNHFTLTAEEIARIPVDHIKFVDDPRDKIVRARIPGLFLSARLVLVFEVELCYSRTAHVLLPVAMGWHPRLGQNSLFNQLSDDNFAKILDMCRHA
jgi:hypothetical protein